MYKTNFTKAMENEFGKFNEIPVHFRPELNENPTHQEMFIYIKNHFRYNTMNAWNGSTSFANNVKIHNLNFTDKQIKTFFDLTSDEFTNTDLDLFYDNINENMLLFSNHYDYNYTIGFNGRSSGYLVLYKSSKKTSKNIISYPGKSIGENFDDYSSAQSYIDDNGEYSLESYFELVYDFDTICDIIRYTVSHELDQEIEEYEIPQPIIKKKRFKTN